MPAPQTVWRTPEHSALLSRRIKDGWARVKAGEGYIYVASFKSPHFDLIKIGHALDPYRRVREQGMTPDKEILATILAPRAREHELHRALRGLSTEHGREFYPPSILDHPACRAIFASTRTNSARASR